MNIELGNRLLELRKKNNLSQEELANKLGISRQAISKWERAEASPDTDNLIALSKIYNITIDELLKQDEGYDYEYVSNSGNSSTDYSNNSNIDSKDLNTKKSNDNDKKDYVYANNANSTDTVYKDINKEYKYDNDGNRIEQVHKAKSKNYENESGLRKKLLMFPFPLLVTLVYLAVGFTWHMWHPAWILFLTIPIYYCLVPHISDEGALQVNEKMLKAFPYPIFITIVYLLAGFYLDLWHPGWILFLTIPCYYSFVPKYFK